MEENVMAGFGNNLPMMQMQMQQLEQQRMMLQQQMQAMNGMNVMGSMQMAQSIKGRPVASMDEVKGAMVDFDGSVSFFPSLANNKIYTKQIGLDGNPVYSTYVKQDGIEISSDNRPVGLTQDDFNYAMEGINKRFDDIYELLGGKQNVSIRTNDANVQRQKSATNNAKSDDAAISK